MSNKIKIFTPATISNLGCGFDIIGLAIESVGDEMLIKTNKSEKIRITKITGYNNIPYQTSENVAGVALQAMLEHLNEKQGFDIEINKKIKPGSGIGSSAASAAGVVVAANELLGKPLTRKQLVQFAMKGEILSSGSEHADNVAPAVLGGITLIRTCNPLDIIKITTPKKLYCVLLHPQIEIKTIEARNILNQQVSLKSAINQWGNVAGLIAGLINSDYDLIGRSIEDHIIEPQRSKLIKGYWELKNAAIEAGALGVNISGSGPSVFALTNGKQKAEEVKKAMENQYLKEGINFNIYLSGINEDGVKIL